MSVKLLGLAAKARSGKDTVGEYLRDEYNYKLYAFADPIKQAASKMFGISLDQFYEGDRELVNEFWGFSPREILQKLGTEAGRNVFRKDIWLKRGLQEWETYKKDIESFVMTFPETMHHHVPSGLVFTDVRFENEATMIREQGGQVVHIIRNDAEEVSDHVSEAGIAIADGDVVIYNNDTLEDLYINVSDILGDNT